MDIRQQTRELNLLTIRSVGSHFGLNLPDRGTVRCPFPDHQDKTPSFEIKPSGNRWICYGCNRRGGTIDFVKVYRGIDFLEAKSWLSNQLGNENSSKRIYTQKKPSRPTIAQPSQTQLQIEEAPPDYEVYEAFLYLSPIMTSGSDYLLSRCISKSIISAANVGQLSESKSVLSDLINRFGYDRIYAAGLLTKKSTKRTPMPLFPDNCIVFPFLEQNRPAYIQARALSNFQNKSKWRNLNGRKRRLYNADTLLNSRDQPLAICEGILDSLSAIEMNYDAIGLMGTNAVLSNEEIKRMRGRQVLILLDWDEPGEKRATKLQFELRRYGITSTRKTKPSPTANDLNDYLVETKEKA